MVGVLGLDPFQGLNVDGTGVNYLDKLVEVSNANRSKSNRKQNVVERFDSAKDYTPCHILFVSSHASATSEEKTGEDRLRAALKKLRDPRF